MTKNTNFELHLTPVDKRRKLLTYRLSVSAYGNTIWPVLYEPEHPLEIQIDDLFSYLVEFWKPLMLRQTYPLDLSPIRPSLLSRDVVERWQDMRQEQIDNEASQIDSFEEAHDLSHALGGLFDLPPLWFVREGDLVICDTGRTIVKFPFDVFRAALTKTGDEIAEHLMAVDAGKWDRVVEAWRRRDASSGVNLVLWSASLEADVAEALINRGLITPPQSLTDAAKDDDELLIAARMAGALPTDQILEILSVARRFNHHDTPRLDALSSAALEHLNSLSPMKPFGEGEELAAFVRQWLKIGSNERLDIFSEMTSLGIEVLAEAVGPSTFDGLAIAGSHYGPGAFINTDSGRVRDKNTAGLGGNAGARVNLAHELCHLLVDRNHPLSAVEVLRSRMPASIESRARAFAAELLLPGAAAANLWDRSGSPTSHDELEAVLQELADSYGVSFSVAAWKLEHGARRERRELSAMLDILARYR
jgi:hypothetical protein